MSENRADPAVCGRCGSEYEAASPDSGLCPDCRAAIIRRSGRWARIIALAATALIGTAVVLLLRPERFLLLWMVLLAAVYFVCFKVGRRVAFDLIRGREMGTGEAP